MSGVQYPTIAIDLADYIANNRQGKIIVYRAATGEDYIPIAETTNATYTDFSAEPGETYSYKYKYIFGARDGGLLKKPIVLTAVVTPDTTPAPTCALYKYSYSHTVSHTTLGDITGNYNFDPQQGAATNASSDVQMIYNAHAETWVIASKTTVIRIRHLPSSTNISLKAAEGIYISQNSWPNSQDWWKSTNTSENRVRISYVFHNSSYTIIDPNNEIFPRGASLRWSTGRYVPRSRNRPRYTAPGTITSVNYQNNMFEIESVRVQDLSPEELLQYIDSNAVYYTNKASTSKFIPRTGWEPSSYWESNPQLNERYFKNAVLSIDCFQLTPTPTPTFPPTPLPPPPTPTPTPTSVVSSLIYFMTEDTTPLTTELGDYFVPE